MEGNNETIDKKKGLSKGAIIGIFIGIILLIGGGVAAYQILWDNSPKAKYFAAEKATFEYMEDVIKDRYEAEFDWSEFTFENPTETTLELSANIGDLANDPMLQQMVNSSKLNLAIQSDMDDKKLSTDLGAEIAGVKIEDIAFSLDEENLYINLPFLSETIKISSGDLGELIRTMDPYAFEEGFEIDFNDVFEQRSPFSEEDQEYFEKEYIKMIYDELSNDSFESVEEDVTVFGEDINAEKITFHLTEDDVKQLLEKLLTKMEKDDELKKIVKNQFELRMGMADDALVQEFMTEFDSILVEAKDSLDQISLPDGITSTIWIDKNIIVKRDFAVKIGDEEFGDVELTITGDQLLTKEQQQFDYEFLAEDAYGPSSLFLEGDLSWKDNKATDSIKLSVPDTFEISYLGSEELNKGTREFNREISAGDGYYGGTLFWDGTSTYEKDQMNSEHSFSLEIDDLGRDLFALNVAVAGQKIKEVEMPSGDNIVDIGQMSEQELNEYIQFDLAGQFQQWLGEIMYQFGGGF